MEEEARFPYGRTPQHVVIPKRFIVEAEGDREQAYLLWWAETERRGIERLLADLQAIGID